MNIKEQLTKYKPFNQQEEIDRELAIKYINIFPDILYRENEIAHMSASSWILNSEHTKVLLIYHKIYNSWSWTGGHTDGDSDLLYVALKEAKEETGLKNIKPIKNDIFSIESLCVNGHIKNGKYVSSHLHINVTYLFEASDKEQLSIKEDENSDVKWFDLDEAIKMPTETWMIDNVYKKLNEKLKYLL